MIWVDHFIEISKFIHKLFNQNSLKRRLQCSLCWSWLLSDEQARTISTCAGFVHTSHARWNIQSNQVYKSIGRAHHNCIIWFDSEVFNWISWSNQKGNTNKVFRMNMIRINVAKYGVVVNLILCKINSCLSYSIQLKSCWSCHSASTTHTDTFTHTCE